jgi:hypothetical protein
MEALHDGSGWTWAIPLHDGTISVGVVLHRDVHAAWHADLGSNDAVYARGLALCPTIAALLTEATRETAVRVWSDYSYVATRFAGPGFRLAGDAAGFIDPLFSSGVHMALLGGMTAAATICAARRGHTDEAHAGAFHDAVVRRAYTRFVLTVAGFYRQIREQDAVVLPGVDNASLQAAFELVQPIVSGAFETEELSEELARRTLRYGHDLILEMHDVASGNPVAKLASRVALEGSLDADLLSIDGWVLRLDPGALGMARLGAVGALGESMKKALYRGILATAARFGGR